MIEFLSRLSDSARDAPPAEGRRPRIPAAFFSVVVHAIVMTVLLLRNLGMEPPRAPSVDRASVEPDAPRVYLPSAAELKSMLAAPTAPPTPPPPPRKTGISIGPRDAPQAKELWLRPEGIPRQIAGDGKPETSRERPSSPSPAKEPAATQVARAETASGDFTLRGNRGDQPPPGPTAAPSIRGSLSRLEERWEQGRGLGTGPVGARTMGPFHYDPQGADFTAWLDQFAREAYRNWVVPQAALMGFRGDVRIGFLFGRDGALLQAEILKTSGTVSLDRAARNAVVSSRQLPLPSDYPLETFPILVDFFY